MIIVINGVELNWPSLLCGAIGTIILLLAFLCKTKENYAKVSFGSYVFNALEAMFLIMTGINAWGAVISNAVCLSRNILVFIWQKKWNKDLPWWVGILFCVVMWCGCIPFYNEWYSYLPSILVTIVTISLLFKDIIVFRWGNIIMECGFVVYNAMIKSYTGIVRDGILTIIAIVSLIICIRDRKKAKLSNK